MRINKFLAQSTGMSRRAADNAVKEKRVYINQHIAQLGEEVSERGVITLDNRRIDYQPEKKTVLFHKPAGYIASRNGQGGKTIYDLLPEELHELKPVGRLDKESSGLLLLTSDGELAHRLTHPSFQKEKVYTVELDKPLSNGDKEKIEHGVQVDDYTSRLGLSKNENGSWTVTMSEGKNRQIRRTFQAVGYEVTKLHRVKFGKYELSKLPPGAFTEIKKLHDPIF